MQNFNNFSNYLSNEYKPFLILGVGNILKTDDGFGVHLVRWINSFKKMPNNIEALELGTSILELYSYIFNRKRVTIIDTIKSKAKPGTVYKIPFNELEKEKNNNLILHDINIIMELANIKAIRGEIPYTEILCIVPKETKKFGTELTSCLKKKLPYVADMAIKSVLGESNK